MAEKNFFARLFGLEDANFTTNREEENQVENNAKTYLTESDGATLQDVVNFVAELQSYYYNDICKMQTDLVVQTSMAQNKVGFLRKKIKQDQVALSQIDEILDLVKENEREYQSIWRKSIYSFYDEIERVKLKEVQEKIFPIILKLCVINTKIELKSIILNRIKKYMEAWEISEEIQIPTNFKVILVDEKNGVEKYQFGEYTKKVIANDDDKALSMIQLEKICTMDFEFPEPIPTDKVWVYASSVTRLQLNYMRRTCFIDNMWEYVPDEDKKLYLDVVKVCDLKQYLKGILQIVLTKRNFAVISIVIPTNDMRTVIEPTEQKGNKIEICKKYRFYLKERSGLYKGNLLTARIDRRNIPEKLQFVSYLEFKKTHF